MKGVSNKYLVSAILIGLVFHGTTIFYTLEATYDALIHLFFAEHYASSWFEPWSYKWYTGFTVMSYPPLVHQSIGALSLIGGLKFGLFTVALISVVLFITGVYRFSLLLSGNKKVAGYASLIAVFSSSFIETLHIFGQLPSIIGISVLLHSLPEIYQWIKTGRRRYLVTSLSLIAVTVCSHHVTPIFGMVFFIFPQIGMVLMDQSREKTNSTKEITFKIFLQSFLFSFKRIVVFGFSSLALIILCILPYWINSKNNPITQVPIPHGSRDSFIEVTSSGLVFFLIPWGIMLLVLPYIFYRFYSKRFLFFGLSITLLTILGTGGTTFLPRAILGDTAFDILTLDRFTLWASIMSLPIFGELVYRFVETDLKKLIQRKYGAIFHRLLGGFLLSTFLFVSVFTISLGLFRPSQPQTIKMLPIVNFLNQDQHDQWRYLTLGFGDQMAWLSAQTKALTVDGNYHSARRIPELTSRAVERLENSKFKGIEGLGSLQQFLTVPEKYNLKYIFSNDKFYDPVLYFCGWQRLKQLENGIMIWEKLNVPPLSAILPKEDVPTYQKIMWGIIPFTTLLLALLFTIQFSLIRILRKKETPPTSYLLINYGYDKFPLTVARIVQIWGVIISLVFIIGCYNLYSVTNTQDIPEVVVKDYYNALDFKEFEKAHTLINPNKDISIAQYMLEVAVNDGLLSSYAKLDSISTEIISINEKHASIKAYTSWVTPLEKIDKVYYLELIKTKGKWYIDPAKSNNKIAPDQLYSQNLTKYYNHGRRKITTEQTYHEDILKSPDLLVLSATLVKQGNQYSVVGEVQNIDNFPADVIVTATLYSENNKQLAKFNSKHSMKHKLMPKEVTSFKVDFESVAWMDLKSKNTYKFNPDEFTPINLTELPVSFNLHCSSNVSGLEFYSNVELSNLEVTDKILKGSLFNSGTQEVTVSQVLISYYNQNKELIWVDHQFIKEGIRQQKNQLFEYPLKDISTIEKLLSSTENCLVNGIKNSVVLGKYFPNKSYNKETVGLQLIPMNGGFVKFEFNNFIGNPN